MLLENTINYRNEKVRDEWKNPVDNANGSVRGDEGGKQSRRLCIAERLTCMSRAWPEERSGCRGAGIAREANRGLKWSAHMSKYESARTPLRAGGINEIVCHFFGAALVCAAAPSAYANRVRSYRDAGSSTLLKRISSP